MDQNGSATAVVPSGGGQLHPRIRTGRRQLLKGMVAVADVVSLGGCRPRTLWQLGTTVALAVYEPPSPVQGSPGFWKDGGKRQTSLWNTVGDIDRTDWVRKPGPAPAAVSNPFVKADQFTVVFASHPGLVGLEMQDVLEGADGATDAQKAARACSGGLGASRYGVGYPYTQTQPRSRWGQAVTEDTHAAFEALKG